MSQSVEELLEECGRLHGHICPGQLLGIRMALLGCRLVYVNDPKGSDRKKLLVWVEIDRCVTDAISAVTGVRMGRRSLKFLNYGKVAATFLNIAEGVSYRIVALDESRALADSLCPEVEKASDRQMLAYRELREEQVFRVERVKVSFDEFDLPGRPRSRIFCQCCGEGVNDGREVFDGKGQRLCRSCAFGSYYQVSD